MQLLQDMGSGVSEAAIQIRTQKILFTCATQESYIITFLPAGSVVHHAVDALRMMILHQSER